MQTNGKVAISNYSNSGLMDTEIIIVIIILLIVFWLWRVVCKYIAKKANFVKEIGEHTGPKIASSRWRWGRADINGVYFKNGIKVIHYEKGYVLQRSPVWGGGKLWIPKDSMETLEMKADAIFTMNKRISIKSGENEVYLSGDLAEFVIDSLA